MQARFERHYSRDQSPGQFKNQRCFADKLIEPN